MKKCAYLLVAIVCAITSSCVGRSDIDDLQNQIDALQKNQIATVQEQISSISNTITSLEQVDVDGDLTISGQVTNYTVSTAAVTAQEVAAQNRLTVTVKVSFANRKHPEDDFTDKTFSAYADYDSTNSLDAVESTLTTEIVEKLVEDIFNATVAQW